MNTGEERVQLIFKVVVPSIKKCLLYIWEHLGLHTSELTLTCCDELHSSLKNANFSFFSFNFLFKQS